MEPRRTHRKNCFARSWLSITLRPFTTES